MERREFVSSLAKSLFAVEATTVMKSVVASVATVSSLAGCRFTKSNPSNPTPEQFARMMADAPSKSHILRWPTTLLDLLEGEGLDRGVANKLVSQYSQNILEHTRGSPIAEGENVPYDIPSVFPDINGDGCIGYRYKKTVIADELFHAFSFGWALPAKKSAEARVQKEYDWFSPKGAKSGAESIAERLHDFEAVLAGMGAYSEDLGLDFRALSTGFAMHRLFHQANPRRYDLSLGSSAIADLKQSGLIEQSYDSGSASDSEQLRAGLMYLFQCVKRSGDPAEGLLAFHLGKASASALLDQHGHDWTTIDDYDLSRQVSIPQTLALWEIYKNTQGIPHNEDVVEGAIVNYQYSV